MVLETWRQIIIFKKLKEFKVIVSAKWTSGAQLMEGNYFSVVNLTELVVLKSTYLNTTKNKQIGVFQHKNND